MNSSKALVSSKMASFGFSSMVKSRGMKQVRLDDIFYKPGGTQDRGYQRTWGRQTAEQPEDGERLDDTRYIPGRWKEREYQATWREPVAEEEEPQDIPRDSHRQQERPSPPVSQRRLDPKRRLQRIVIPASQFISQFLSTQSRNKKRNLEAAADRMAYDEYQLA
ncbi:uncharacterized protein LOC108090376 [Drosophila ficusphila]|uniref:uncharacterized protein LOC108090376 n=1 Tax=Drosophila ficusphila TaxID=30025 RepID=UPI0007E6C019|nr:uncharacterized protein LOC108090376 [Drosophila ficusphila]